MEERVQSDRNSLRLVTLVSHTFARRDFNWILFLLIAIQLTHLVGIIESDTKLTANDSNQINLSTPIDSTITTTKLDDLHAENADSNPSSNTNSNEFSNDTETTNEISTGIKTIPDPLDPNWKLPPQQPLPESDTLDLALVRLELLKYLFTEFYTKNFSDSLSVAGHFDDSIGIESSGTSTAINGFQLNPDETRDLSTNQESQLNQNNRQFSSNQDNINDSLASPTIPSRLSDLPNETSNSIEFTSSSTQDPQVFSSPSPISSNSSNSNSSVSTSNSTVQPWPQPRPYNGDFFHAFQAMYWPIHAVACLAICTIGIFFNLTNIVVLTR